MPKGSPEVAVIQTQLPMFDHFASLVRVHEDIIIIPLFVGGTGAGGGSNVSLLIGETSVSKTVSVNFW